MSTRQDGQSYSIGWKDASEFEWKYFLMSLPCTASIDILSFLVISKPNYS